MPPHWRPPCLGQPPAKKFGAAAGNVLLPRVKFSGNSPLLRDTNRSQEKLPMAVSVKSLIAHCVNQVIRQYYPTQYCSLCHVYAIVGSNLISIVLDRVYRPVAGLAAVDCGGGQLMRMADNEAFSHPAGGAYHCWIESADDL